MDLFDKISVNSIKSYDQENNSEGNDKNEEEKDKLICKNCNNLEFKKDFKNGFIICTSCGLVCEKKIINSNPEWRWYGSNDSKNTNPTRCGMPMNPLLPKSSMNTFIGGNRYGTIQRLHNWNSMPSFERSLYNVFKEINLKTKDTNLLKKIVEDTKLYYKILNEHSKETNKHDDENCKSGILTRGLVRKGIISACLFVACKNNNVPRVASEIAAIFNIKTTDVTKGLKKFIEIEMKKNININNNIINCSNFIKRYGNIINVGQKYIEIAEIIASRAQKLNIVNDNTPQSIVAGTLYLIIIIYNLKIHKSELKKKLNISDVTVSKCYKKLFTHKEILFLGIKSWNKSLFK